MYSRLCSMVYSPNPERAFSTIKKHTSIDKYSEFSGIGACGILFKISDDPIVEIPRFWISVWYCVKITIFSIYVVHIMSYNCFVLLHIAYPEHLSKVKILLVPKVFTFLFTYAALILCSIR